mmetsp:Transcript_22510/g.32418  ORF Transcript_22510/g.32418 Transcript_22510/m.32418 type:complete len:200 (+) Transcript_22510:673-1272(+)
MVLPLHALGQYCETGFSNPSRNPVWNTIPASDMSCTGKYNNPRTRIFRACQIFARALSHVLIPESCGLVISLKCRGVRIETVIPYPAIIGGYTKVQLEPLKVSLVAKVHLWKSGLHFSWQLVDAVLTHSMYNRIRNIEAKDRDLILSTVLEYRRPHVKLISKSTVPLGKLVQLGQVDFPVYIGIEVRLMLAIEMLHSYD